MNINPHIFRAYDIRGVYPGELNEESAYCIARAYCKLFPSLKRLVVSQDFRLSSPSLARALIRGLQDEGRAIIDIGQGSVPVFYFAIVREKADGGLMITGSHNPPNENGVKLQKRNALPVSDKEIERMKKIVFSDSFAPPAQHTGSIRKKRYGELYIKHLIRKTKLARPLRVVLDMGNGACGNIPELIFKGLGCKVKSLFLKPDGKFPNHIPDPHKIETLQSLQAEVKKFKADLGLAYDGDGDRVGAVDEGGGYVGMDFVLMMMARQSLAKANVQRRGKKFPVVVDVRASQALLDDIAVHGGRPFMVRVGRSFIITETLKKKAVFGGEFTGHMFFPNQYFNFDDGIFASVKIAEAVSLRDSFSSYVRELPRYVASPEIFIESADEEKFEKIKKLVRYVKQKGFMVIDLDGARIEFPAGWALIRASNTTPHIKVRFEGKTKSDLHEIAGVLITILKATGITVPKGLHSF